MAEPAPKKPLSRWFRFSLGAMLLVMTGMALWLGWYVDLARRQARGVDWVVQQRGHLAFAHQGSSYDGTYNRNARPPGPAWLHESIGLEYFTTVTGVTLDCEEIRTLEPLTDLTRLRGLTLWNYVHGGTDFAVLRRLGRLEQLHLGFTGLSEAEVEAIRELLPDCTVTLHD